MQNLKDIQIGILSQYNLMPTKVQKKKLAHVFFTIGTHPSNLMRLTVLNIVQQSVGGKGYSKDIGGCGKLLVI